ncbi:AAA family ATPase [Corynebacterium timonense]|uniref:DNA repair exonuclease SbcCD ATPase subunit n=1 Tax=Corynebacterium timonense TaxID=441500 RepID=A0A1H1QAF5_9CORY|nr:AAA family ATPase [Corynebacterium timonense]SDS19859.1 DNA repair exonuclease SbcCD ATPase subunit [Corynebacterium timonense]
MRIHDLIIDNVRAVEHLELRDLPDTGVILIHGDNESGKSTILDALDAVLTERYSAKKNSIRALQPVGRDVGPEVRLTATVGPYTFTARKRFLKSAESELTITAPKSEQLSGRAADDKLEAIVAEHLDGDLADILFVRQGDTDPGISAAGIPSVTRALDAGGEDTLAGTEDTALMGRITDEYARYFTPQGKKKSTYTELEKAVEDAQAELAARRAAVDELSGAVDEVGRLTAEVTEIDAELPEAVAESAQREKEEAAAKQAEAKATEARERRERADVDLERAAADLEARREARQQLETLRSEAAELDKLLGPAAQKATDEEETIARLTKERDEARARLAEAREKAQEARRASERARRQRRRRELTELADTLDAVDAQLTELLQKTPERPVTDADVREIDKAASEAAVQRRLADAASAKLEVTASAAASLRVDGRAVDLDEGTGDEIRLADGTTVEIGDITAVYRAGAGAAGSTAALDEAERALAEALAAVGCADVDEARVARDEHATLAAAVEAARERRAQLTEGRDADELRAELARLQEDEDKDGDSDEQLDDDEADAAYRAAGDAVDAAAEEAAQAEAALVPWEGKTAAAEATTLRTKKDLKEEEIARQESVLEAAEHATPLSALLTAHGEATERAAALRAEEEKLAQEVAALDPALAAQLHAGARARVDNLKQRRAEAQERIARLSSHIDVATGAAEQADRAEAALEAAEQKLARSRRRAEAVELLWHTMRAHRDAARARYAQPFAQALNRYAAVIFGPDVEFTLGEDLGVEARTVGETTVPLDQLSGGAKEQMALLTRFAVADLAGNGENGAVPVPVVIDDALGATDPDRLARMNTLFDTVGRDAQVVVLTCFPRRFDRVVPAVRASISELKNQHTITGVPER